LYSPAAHDADTFPLATLRLGATAAHTNQSLHVCVVIARRTFLRNECRRCEPATKHAVTRLGALGSAQHVVQPLVLGLQLAEHDRLLRSEPPLPSISHADQQERKKMNKKKYFFFQLGLEIAIIERGSDLLLANC
jgi:hypothetical protein